MYVFFLLFTSEPCVGRWEGGGAGERRRAGQGTTAARSLLSVPKGKGRSIPRGAGQDPPATTPSPNKAATQEYEIVIGKYFASFAIVLIMITGTFFYPLLLVIFGIPDIGPLLTGYFGLCLYSAATLSVGIFASSLSSNQLVSLVVGSGILTVLTFIDFMSSRLSGIAGQILEQFQLGGSFSVFDTNSFGIAESGHFADFAKGIISIYDIMFYLSITIIFLISTILVLESRRWK